MKTFKCLLCGKIYTQQSAPDSCEECGADVTDFEVVEIEGFKTSGKWPPVANDLIRVNPEGFGIVESIVNGSFPATYLKALIYDYRGDSGTVEVHQASALGYVPDNDNKVVESDYSQLREALGQKNLTFDYATGKVEFKPGRLAAGQHYYFINDKLALEEATDDGLSSGIHAQRFAQVNYFPDAVKVRIADKVLANVRANVQKHPVSGVY